MSQLGPAVGEDGDAVKSNGDPPVLGSVPVDQVLVDRDHEGVVSTRTSV